MSFFNLSGTLQFKYKSTKKLRAYSLTLASNESMAICHKVSNPSSQASFITVKYPFQSISSSLDCAFTFKNRSLKQLNPVGPNFEQSSISLLQMICQNIIVVLFSSIKYLRSLVELFSFSLVRNLKYSSFSYQVIDLETNVLNRLCSYANSRFDDLE